MGTIGARAARANRVLYHTTFRTPRAPRDAIVSRMSDHPPETVEASLDALIEAVGKAAADLHDVRTVLTRARADIAAHNTTVSRDVVVSARRAVEHLRGVDEALRRVLTSLETRD